MICLGLPLENPRITAGFSSHGGSGRSLIACAENGTSVKAGLFQEAEIDFVADNPGLTLFHCHQQLHMDHGFMTLFDYK